jgi:hypothetical protein
MLDSNLGPKTQSNNPYLPLYRLAGFMAAIGAVLAGIVWLSHNGAILWRLDELLGLNPGDTLLDWMIVLIAWPIETWAGPIILGAVILLGIVALVIFARTNSRKPAGAGHRVGHMS